MGDQKENLHDEVITVKYKREDNDNNEPLPEFEKLPAKVKYIKSKSTKNGVRANFCFELTGDFEGRRAWGSVPYWKEPNNETDMYKWLSNILGKPLEDNISFKLGDVVGKKVLIVIENSNNTDENGNPYQNVVQVLKSNDKGKVNKKTKKEKEDVLEESVLDDEENEEKEVKKQKKKKSKNTSESSDDIDEDDLPF